MNIDELQIEIRTNANEASKGLDTLAASLGTVKGATGNNAGLRKIATSLREINSAAQVMDLAGLAGQMEMLAGAMAPLQNLGKNSLASFLTSLQKIPKITQELQPEKLDAFAQAIAWAAEAVRPLANEMDKVYKGFSAMPARIQRFITQIERSGKSSGSAASGYRSMSEALAALNQKFNVGVMLAGMRRMSSVIADFVANSNKYVEDLNLFQVSLGKFADEAYEYAQRAQALMGIDAADFLRNQGIFQSIATGFGVASDKAYILSKNLTQLSYDIASFYNLDTETAFLKLQSAISGELEPVRRLGYAIDQATLQQVAYNLGIQQSVRDMTQADKAQLRYITIMQQSGNVMLDMARTLHTPANAMRIFHAQLNLLSRSIGNVFVPILMQALPYVIAFVRVLRMAADALARFFGFTLPTIDYAGMKGFSANAGGLADNLNNAAGAAKKLKDYVLGIDELNILKPQEDGGAGNGNEIGGGGGLDFPVEDYQYDFLQGLQAQADKLIPTMKKVAIALGVILGLMALFKAFKGLMEFIELWKKLKTTLLGLKFVQLMKAFGTAFKTGFLGALRGGSGPIAAIGAGLKGMRQAALDNMSTFARFAVGITAIVAAVALVYKAVKGLTLSIFENGVSFDNLGKTLLIVIPILALLGAAIYVMLGPIGLIIAAVAALVAGIIAVVNATNEHNKQLAVNAVFAENGGVPVRALADNFFALTDSINANSEAILANKTRFDEVNASIATSSSRVLTLSQANWTTLEEAQIVLPILAEEYQKMSDGIVEAIELAGSTLQTALIDLPQEAYEVAGTTMPALQTTISTAVTGMSEEVLALSGRFNELMEQLQADPTNEALKTELSEVTQRLAELGGTSVTAADEYAASVAGMVPIDFSELVVEGDADATLANMNALIGDITESGAEAQAKLGEAYDAIMQSMDTLTAGLSPEDAQALRDTFAAAFELESDKIVEAQQETIRLIKEGLTTQIDTLAEDVQPLWYDKLLWEPEKAKEVAQERFKETFDGVFEALDTAEQSATVGQSLVDGLANGIRDGDLTTVQANARGLGESAVEALNEGTGTDSPSWKAAETGEFFDEGLAQGIADKMAVVEEAGTNLALTLTDTVSGKINENAHKPITSFKNMLNGMLSALQGFADSVASSINQTMQGIANAMGSASFNGTSVSYSAMGAASVPMLAGGGRVNSGQIFIANEGGRPPELVGSFGGQTGVMNNDQIVDAVSRGVYEAVSDALLSNADLFQDHTPIQIGDEVIVRSYERGKRARGYGIAPAPLR